MNVLCGTTETYLVLFKDMYGVSLIHLIKPIIITQIYHYNWRLLPTSSRPHSGMIYKGNFYRNNMKWGNIFIRCMLCVHNSSEIYADEKLY